MKKLFPDSKKSKKGLLEFLDKKGFYIILILCIAVVGTTAVFVTRHNMNSPDSEYDDGEYLAEGTEVDDLAGLDDFFEEDQPDISTDAASSITQDPAEAKASPLPGASPAASAAPKAGTGDADAKPLQKPAKSPAPAQTPGKTSSTSTAFAEGNQQSFIMPVAGEVTTVFAQDKLVYSQTMDDWRAHNGVDLAAERGTNVKAVADGIVEDVKSDPRYGFAVVLDHQNGLKTIYSNLASNDVVSPNQIIVQGEIIGSVGNTALFEAADQPHLHFQVLKDDVLVDPMEYLAKSDNENK